jgi:hypothetical protein
LGWKITSAGAAYLAFGRGKEGGFCAAANPHQLRKGSTPALILTLLEEKPMYGYQIARELKRRSEGYFEMKEGLLYPALHRMERDGWRC